MALSSIFLLLTSKRYKRENGKKIFTTVDRRVLFITDSEQASGKRKLGITIALFVMLETCFICDIMR